MEANNHNLETTMGYLEKLVLRLPPENTQSCTPDIFNCAISDTLKDFQSECMKLTNALSENDVELNDNERWKFITISCSLLDRLCCELHEETLGLSRQTLVRKCVLWTVTLGIIPNLTPLVRAQLQVLVNPVLLTEEEDITSIQKYRRLCAVVKVLVKCLYQPVLRSIVLRFLGYILAALCQLGYAPLKKPSSGEGPNELSLELYETFRKEQIHYRNVLDKLVNSIYQPQVIQELMLIQGGQKGRPPPPWLIKICSQLLTQLLLTEGGISAVIRSTMDSEVDTGIDWKTVNILAKIITSPKSHYKNICNQLLKLITDSNVSKSCRTVSIACINELLVKEQTMAQVAIIDKLLEPLICLSEERIGNCFKSEDVIVKEQDFTLCIQHLHEYFAVKTSSNNCMSLPSHLLHPVLHILFSLYGAIKESVSHLSSLVADLLFIVFSNCSSVELSEVIKMLVFRGHSDNILVTGNVSFVLGSEGGVMAKREKFVERGVEYSAVEEAGNILMYLLEKKDSNGKLSNSIFMILLEILSDFGIAPKDLESCSSVLGTVEDAICGIVSRSENHMGAVRLLAALAERDDVQRRLSENPDCIVGFLELLLERETEFISNNGGSDFSDNQDMICVALMILEVIINGDKREVDWDKFKSLAPLLDKIKTLAVTDELRMLSSHISDAIVARGAVKDSPEDTVCETGKQQSSRNQSTSSNKNECDKAFQDACDPLLPVRGHAIIKLAELINNRDKQALSKKDAILCLFQENLKHDDSFIYLAAINGIAAMTNYFPDTVLSILTDEFTQAVSAGNSGSEGENLTRMKIGEVLVKVIRLLGEMAPKYKNQLVNTFLVGVRDVDPLVRASSLSNLGEACRLLGFRVGPVLQEILLCIRDVINTDKAVEPRRAAVMVVTLLLQGLQKDVFEVLESDALSLYRCLKQLYLRETDDVIRLHVDLALAEMDDIVRSFLSSESNLQKRIVMS